MSWGKFFKSVGKAVGTANTPAPPPRPKSFPRMTMAMIDSKGEPITKAQAVKLYKEYMLAVGFLDKDELTYHADDFAEEITRHQEELEHEAENDLASLQEQLKDLETQRKGETDAETKEFLKEEIASVKDDIKHEKTTNQPAVDALAAFKKDKRQFLIDYVNHEVQGA